MTGLKMWKDDAERQKFKMQNRRQDAAGMAGPQKRSEYRMDGKRSRQGRKRVNGRGCYRLAGLEMKVRRKDAARMPH